MKSERSSTEWNTSSTEDVEYKNRCVIAPSQHNRKMYYTPEELESERSSTERNTSSTKHAEHKNQCVICVLLLLLIIKKVLYAGPSKAGLNEEILYICNPSYHHDAHLRLATSRIPRDVQSIPSYTNPHFKTKWRVERVVMSTSSARSGK